MLVALLGCDVGTLQGKPRASRDNAHRAGVGGTAMLLPRALLWGEWQGPGGSVTTRGGSCKCEM